ncbi:MAG: hypothetical protein ACRDHM_09910 [Actinomycetota bacterium]
MELVGTAVNAAVVVTMGIILAWLARGRFEGIEKRLDALEARADRMESRIDGRLDAMQASVDGLRADLTQIALAVGARPRAENA